MMTTLKRAAIAVLALGAFAAGAVSSARAEVKLSGGGATFPNPLYSRWVQEYEKAHPGVKIEYQSIGSGGGIKGITDKTFDFAGSDAPMNEKEKKAAGAPIVHIPSCAGAVVLSYNLPGFDGELKLTGEAIADIYTGKITNWSDPKLAALNEGAKLPNAAITPVYRTDGSGTTFIFTNYLATQSESFKSSVGMGKQVKWPVGQGGKGSEGVTAAVQQTPGTIGYIELLYASENKIPFASVKNKEGAFVKASPETVAAAGAGAIDKMGESLAVDIWNQPGATAYPISAFTYLLVYQDLSVLKSPEKAQALMEFLTWATHDGQEIAKQLGYAPLSPAVVKKVEAAIAGLKM